MSRELSIRAAQGVIAAAMARGARTPAEIAAAEEAAGILFDPVRAAAIADAAQRTTRDEIAADLITWADRYEAAYPAHADVRRDAHYLRQAARVAQHGLWLHITVLPEPEHAYLSEVERLRQEKRELEEHLRAARETVEAEQEETQRLRALVPAPRRAASPAPADDENGMSEERLAACRALLEREATTERDFGYSSPLATAARDLLREVDRRGALLAELDEATADVVAPVALLAKASLVGAEGGGRRG